MTSENAGSIKSRLSDRIANLSAEKRAILLSRLKNIEADKVKTIPKRTSAIKTIPLSYAQERLWFLSQLEPDTAVYNEAGAVELNGKLDDHALKQSLNEIVKRHEILRTRFVNINGNVQQCILSKLSIEVRYENFKELPFDQQSTRTQQWLLNETNRPFDLSVDPLIRFSLLQLAPEKHILFVGLHHIVADGWSVKLLVHELNLIYNALCNGRSSPLPELPIQFADYACWQREWLQGSVLENQLNYWTKQLEGRIPLLELPADFPRPKKLNHHGAKFRFSLSGEIAAALNQLCRRENVTLFMVLAAAYAVQLSRYTNQFDICIGYPIANRPRAELQELMGFFANTLVLRADLSGNPTFSEFLQRVKKVCLEAQEHQDIPFEKLVEELAPERSLNHNPLFQVFLNHTVAENLSIMSGVELIEIEIETGNSKFDLTLDIREKNGELSGWFEYNTELFKESTIARWASHFQAFLERICVTTHTPLSAISILQETEREQLLIDWNATKAAIPHYQNIHQFIEEQVTSQPFAIALTFDGQSITYQTLNFKANQLARYLQNRIIGPESLVGIYIERSLEMIVAMLAVLKAGAAYVPIDSRYPVERIEQVLNDAKPKIILTQQSLQAALPVNAERFCLDTQYREIEGESTKNLNCVTSPDNLAYVIYTSGSTGTPKGVGITHRNVIYSTVARLNYYQTPVTGFLLLSSLAFDSSVAGIFGTLCQGGRLVLSSEMDVLNPAALIHLITSQEISHLLTVPSVYETVLHQISAGAGISLKQIIVAGETCRKKLVELHHDKLPHVQLFNEYGPTETTVWSSVYKCELDDYSNIPIGNPIANTMIYLLDIFLNPVPIGVIGELYIGGEGIARGYLNRPGLSADRYIPDLFGEAGNRLYRTGDLARYRDDGEIEYVGRADHQVKIRGFRIELGEIESMLLQHEQIDEAVVIAREDTSGDKRLVAYVVANKPILNGMDVRAYLVEKLPDYMIPAAVMLLDQLPLNSNGKVERKSLPVPDIHIQSIDQTVEFKMPTEKMVADIWCEVLGLQQIGVQDNFFELGGHSLLVIQVISRVYDVFAIELPLHIIFEKPVLKDFAREIDHVKAKNNVIEISPLVSVPRAQPLLLSYSQERLWFLDQFEPGGTFYNMPGVLRLEGELDVGLLERSINEIIRRHEVLRTTFSAVDGKPEQVIAPLMSLEIKRIDLIELTDERREAEIRRYLEEDIQQPFDLLLGPLVRATLLSLGKAKISGEAHYILLFTLHHIVSDGWSTAILIREFIALYEAYRAGRASPLAELTVQYADYAIWQRKWLQGERLEQQVNYWKQQLAGAPAILELPADYPRPAVQSYRGATLYTTVSPSVTGQLQQLGRQQDATLFMVLLAAFNILLSRYSGQDDLCVGTPIANRNRLEIEGLIGFFINTLVLRTDLSGNPTFMELLTRVKAVCLGAQIHQDLPFEKLVEELSPVRDMSHNPLFQVMLALQNTPETALEIEGLKIAPEVMEVGTSKFDLDLEITESEGGLEIQYSYNTDLFARSTIERLAGHFGVLLESIAANPNRLISELPFLTTKERNQLLTQWNGSEVTYPSGHCIHQLFEMQAMRHPDAIAVVFEDKQLSYEALNQKANRLAHFLKSQGIGPEVLVGICIERSLEMMVGILGILKAGGAYLPVEPELPEGKLRLILQDSGIEWVLTSSTLSEKIPKRYHTLYLDQEVSAGYSAQPLASSGLNPRQLAYMLYTSGTTGIPKGVGVTHSNLINQYYAWETAYDLEANDVHLQMARYTFDVFAGDWIRALCSGGKLVICSRETLLQPDRLYALLQSELITVAEFVPAVLRALADYLDDTQHRLDFMRLLICGSDRWYMEEYKRFLKLCGQTTRLVNSYGLTEATIDSTYFESPLGDSLVQELVPIGQQFANTRCYILDRWLNPVPIGVAGELYIGGAGVVRGYFNRAELTAERFVPDPFSQQTGERLYKTGDVVRYQLDGNIEHLGRTDHQVKIRGLRIELGEIEAALLQHPQIRQAVVVAGEEGTSEVQRLVAYVAGDEAQLEIAELHNYLKAYLVDYMIPSIFVLLDEMPLNANGKINRKALPQPSIDGQIADQYVAPRNEIEEKIALIWAEVLGIDRIGIHDNFFQLGGHSLLAIQIISRIYKQFGIKLPLREIFQSATIALLAEAIGIAQWREVNSIHDLELEYEDIAI